MKKQKANPAKCKVCVLRQLCNFIPGHLVAKLARQYGVDKKARSFSPWSHVVSLLYAQITHAIGLNDVCDGLVHHRGLLASIRGASAPSRNGLSYANKHRDARMAGELFWSVLKHLQSLSPGFAGGKFKGFPRRFKRVINIVDSSTIGLVANCMDWAKHRRRKAAAKCHMRLDLQSFLPRFAIIDTARDNDAKRAREMCAALKAGEIVLFDKAYIDLAHLFDLSSRGIYFVTRAKENMALRCVKRLLKKPKGNILRDDLVVLKNKKSRQDYPQPMRRVTAWVEIDGQWRVMEFLTNNLQWSPHTISELYRCRWSIETFFRQIKQTLNLCDFLGHSANAVRWQIWSALLLYVLLRFQAWLSRWEHSFVRLFALVRGVLWDRFNLRDLLDFYGTAGGRFRMRATPQQAYFPGFG